MKKHLWTALFSFIIGFAAGIFSTFGVVLIGWGFLAVVLRY